MSKQTKQKKPKTRGLPDRLDGPENPNPTPLSEFTEFDYSFEGQKYTFQARFELITPDYARYVWNNLNPKNRNPSAKHARRLAKDVADGRFVLTGEPIIFDENCELCNGQHRIFAIAMGGEPVVVLVVRGAPQDIFTKIDKGVIRSAADCLSIHGVKHADLVARVARRVKQYQSPKHSTISRRGAFLDNDEIITFIGQNPRILSSVNATFAINKGRTVAGVVTPTQLAFLHYVVTGQHQAMGEEFIKLMSGPGYHLINLPGQREILAHLCNRLAKLANDRKKGAIPEALIASLVLSAWNTFCRVGRARVKKLQLPKMTRKRSPAGIVTSEKYNLPSKLEVPTKAAIASVQAINNQVNMFAMLQQQQQQDAAATATK